MNFVNVAGHITTTPLQPILKVYDTATSVIKVTKIEDEKRFEESVEAKLATAAAEDIRIVKADRRSRPQALKSSPAMSTSVLQFFLYC